MEQVVALLDPRLPDYDVVDWAGLPFSERLRLQCGTWASQGFGTPWPIFLMYVVKAGLFVLGWALFAGSTADFGGISQISSWWDHPVAFQKAIAWAMLFEGLGFGCGSGPLTGRYFPPFVAFTHFLRPGTTRLAPWPDRNPIALGHRRTVIDVVLYAGLVASILRVLSADVITTSLLVPIVVLLPLLGLRDQTIFLIFRSEHYLLTVLVFVIAGDGSEAIAGAQLIQLAIWWGAAASKLNRHFPFVVAIMVSNAPLVPGPVRRAMFRAVPDDMRPSGLAGALAHGGTVIEFVFPLLLIFGEAGTITNIALVVMLVFHGFIMVSVALGVPTEWNILFVYSMFVLFGRFAEVSPADLGNPVLIVILLVALVGLPVLANLRPDLVSFLIGMRYYAGNWNTTAWLFRKGTMERLDEHIVKTSETVDKQLGRFYDDDLRPFLLGKVATFRTMHLHGRLYSNLLPMAVEGDLDDYVWIDGELVAGLVLGWNFGEGHLHDEQLLGIVQEACQFAPGDLRCVMIDGQPAGNTWWAWRIVDAVDGELTRGKADVADFVDQQPWAPADDPSIVGVGR